MQDVTNSADTIPKLFKAIEAGRVDEVRELIETDPKLASARNKDGASALTWAAYYRHTPICELLLKAGADVDARSHGAFTALHIAAANGATRMVEALLNAGADGGAKTEGGKTPIDFAVDGDHSEVVALLERAKGGGM